MAYTKRDVRALYETCVEAGLFPETATLAISSPGDGKTRYSVYNTGGIDSKCYFLGAGEACYGLARMLAAYEQGIEHARRAAGLPWQSTSARITARKGKSAA